MSRCRGARAAKVSSAAPVVCSGVTEVLGEYASRAKAACARLIRKVCGADPLQCANCKGPMRVIALIEEPNVVRAILTHLGRWQREALERAPPVPLEPGPRTRACR